MPDKKTPTKIERIKEILEEASQSGRPVTSAEIANRLGIVEDATHPATRKLIKDCAEQYELPLVATGKGYSVVTSSDELYKYIQNLDRRIEGINRRKMMITTNYLAAAKSGR